MDGGGIRGKGSGFLGKQVATLPMIVCVCVCQIPMHKYYVSTNKSLI